MGCPQKTECANGGSSPSPQLFISGLAEDWFHDLLPASLVRGVYKLDEPLLQIIIFLYLIKKR